MDAQTTQRIVIVGGSTGGSSAAAQIRRLSEEAEIVLFEKSTHISTAYCGLAYALGGVVPEVETLIPIAPDQLGQRFNVDVRTRHEVVSIDKDDKTLTIHDAVADRNYSERYDKLLLSTGAAANIPAIEGVELPGVFSLRTVDDLRSILPWMEEKKPRQAVVVGGGFIGLEVVENLKHSGLEVTLIEEGQQLLNHLDREMATLLQAELHAHGIEQIFSARLMRIVSEQGRLRLELDNRQPIRAEMVILATGTRPQTQLAESTGIEIGDLGGMVVDNTLCTGIGDIYAVGDAVELPSRIDGRSTLVQLAAPLSQQVRIAAMNITGYPHAYPGVLGTFVCKVFSLTAAAVGYSERALKRQGAGYNKVIIPATNHVFFYPDVESLTLKVLFDPLDGRLLGAQAVGGQGTDKRIDVLATAITARMTIYDLEYLELGYAPPYGAPRDLVNIAGSVGAGLLRNDIRGIYPDEVAAWRKRELEIIDVRSADEFELGSLPGARNIPAEVLRDHLDGFSSERPILVCCQIGSKSTSSQRMLIQHGYECMNLLGGYTLWRLFHPGEMTFEVTSEAVEKSDNLIEEGIVDVRGMCCPGPMLKVKRHMKSHTTGTPIKILVDDVGFLHDFSNWCERFNHNIHDVHKEDNHYIVVCSK
ncbi:MAG: FAD-dependent oxidoreductase [Candidatus Thiodiazotropha sp.]|nr:FAD-dependent oxidoreductase [Candidatus Thiodiazotropha taylori]MBT3057177.1 FAD-dependent oxidoreductase [Candidatus Thiodiazotropha sp. (ex Lucina pensylvanica)]MBT3061280.1 FAD-dependent oxidoreductase [Candidatus Thiodiazotropha sp. (ex Lucina pensylvanica)]MBV2095682.1 FAD-dependent oxidoreductase [Candidatus Thiodiazotropha sp. (ex Codakia orbicularis)]